MNLAAIARVGLMLIRGLVRKPFLKSSSGLLLVGRGARIKDARYVSHGGRLVIEDFAEVQGRSSTGIHFGQDVSIGRNAQIRPSSYYGGDPGHGLVVGDRSSIASDCFIGCSGEIRIGDDVMLGPAVRVYSENHVFARTDVTIKEQGVERGVTVIEDNCWIGSNTIVLSNVRIGAGSVVAGGSVVTKDIPAGSVAAGNPARVIRTRGEQA